MTIQRSSVRQPASTIATFVSQPIMFALVAAASMPANAASQTATATAAAAAAKASPELVSALAKEIGASPEQAAGAAGALFGMAKSRLTPAEFSQVSDAVPGMASLLNAGPSAGGPSPAAGLTQLGGSAAGLASAANAFSKLGLKPELVAKAVPILTSFVAKSGGANVGNLLASALK